MASTIPLLLPQMQYSSSKQPSLDHPSYHDARVRRSPRLVLQYRKHGALAPQALASPVSSTAPVSIAGSALTPPSTTCTSGPSYRASAYTASVYSDHFDDLYDVSDDDSEVVPLKVSNSVKQYLSQNDVRRESLPSLVIPSPSAWPTIDKLRKSSLPSATKTSPVVPTRNTPLSPDILAKLTSHSSTLKLPGAASTPSLDGSLTSDEIASISPSTPDLRAAAQDDGWDMPMQLNAQAMETLQHLSPNFGQELGPIIEVPEVQVGEMQERGLNIDLAAPRKPDDPLLETEPVSAISLPSPGGFLASLPSATREAWALPAVKRFEPPSTATAETFYDIPWEVCPGNVIEQIVESHSESDSEGPPTARQQDYNSAMAAAATEDAPQEMIIKPREYEYDEEYETKLYETAASNKTRTSIWLSAQEAYLSALRGNNPANSENTSPNLTAEEAISPQLRPETPAKSPSLASTNDNLNNSAKKAVRFANNASKTPVTAIHAPAGGKSDPLFYHAFQYLVSSTHPSDAFDMGQIRADALQAQRSYMPEDHRAQLRGQYKLACPKKPSKDFAHLPNAPNDPSIQKQRDAIAQADRERQALSQISMAHWHLEASRMLSGGSLLSRSVRDAIGKARQAGRTPRVLDLGGILTADWGWAVALEERDAKVYTVTVREPSEGRQSETVWPQHRGPSNHRSVTVSNPWTLPFPTGSFDVVSARTLHALCKTQIAPMSNDLSSPLSAFDFPFAADLGASAPNTRISMAAAAKDEYAATLSEIRRVLAPGGVFHYHLLDAELAPAAGVANTGPMPALHSSSVQFAVALRALGFDPAAGHRSARRLAEAGFDASGVNENWVELPIGGAHRAGAGSTPDVTDVTEVVGSVAWERWILRTRGQKGLEGAARAIEDARKSRQRLAWKLCVGVARR